MAVEGINPVQQYAMASVIGLSSKITQSPVNLAHTLNQTDSFKVSEIPFKYIYIYNFIDGDLKSRQ